MPSTTSNDRRIRRPSAASTSGVPSEFVAAPRLPGAEGGHIRRTVLQFSLDPGTRAQPRNGEGAESRGRVFRIGAWLVWPDGARILFVQRPDDAWVLWCFGSGEPIRQQIPADLAESVIRGRARRRATQPPA